MPKMQKPWKFVHLKKETEWGKEGWTNLQGLNICVSMHIRQNYKFQNHHDVSIHVYNGACTGKFGIVWTSKWYYKDLD